MKKIVIVLLSLIGLWLTANAQKKVEVSAQVDFVSHYIWRGFDNGGITILPQGSISWNNLSFEISGATCLDKEDGRQLDLTLGYKLGPINIGITDYWETGLDYDGRDLYFKYDAEKGAHRFEGNIGYTNDYFSVQAYTMFWGNDFKYDLDNALTRQDGKRAFSSYIEVGVPMYLCGLDWDFKAGFTPFESAYNLTYTGDVLGIPHYQKDYYYAGGPTCVMASIRATKNYKLGEIKIPAFMEINANPYLQKAYLIVGVSVFPF